MRAVDGPALDAVGRMPSRHLGRLCEGIDGVAMVVVVVVAVSR